MSVTFKQGQHWSLQRALSNKKLKGTTFCKARGIEFWQMSENQDTCKIKRCFFDARLIQY